MLNGTGIFTYMYRTNQPNVGKYTSPMDAIIGTGCWNLWLFLTVSVGKYTIHEVDLG